MQESQQSAQSLAVVQALGHEQVDTDLETRLSQLPILKLADYYDEIASLNPFRLTQENPQIFDQFIQIAITRFLQEIQNFQNNPQNELLVDLKYLAEQLYDLIFSASSYEDFILSRENLIGLYNLVETENIEITLIIAEFLGILAEFDQRLVGEAVKIIEKFKNLTFSLLLAASNLEIDSPDEERLSVFIGVLNSEPVFGNIRDIYLEFLQKCQNPEQAFTVFRFFANRLKFIVALELTAQFPEYLAMIRQYFVGRTDIDIFTELPALYREILTEFTHYLPNLELNAFEVDLLESQFKAAHFSKNDSQILDIGHGPSARLLLELYKRGYDVIGIDFVAEHVVSAKELINQVSATDEKARLTASERVFQDSWHQMTHIQDGQIQLAYCLGRSFLHNTSEKECNSFLREAYRVLASDGQLIIDLPDPTQGHYQAARENFTKKAAAVGIVYYSDGYIIDSPDGKNFYERLVQFPRHFITIARLNGFIAKQITTREYQDENGFKNINVYWLLTKTEIPLDWDEVCDL